MEKDIYILAIESSCDETAAAVVKNGRTVLSNVISSQIELHKPSSLTFRSIYDNYARDSDSYTTSGKP